jgi:tetratricopeptide (TPR) repeat protein
VKTIRVVVVVCCCALFAFAENASAQQLDQIDSLLASAQQAQASGNFDSAAEFYRKASAVRPEIPELKANLGLMYYKIGKDQQAIYAFSQAIRLNPGLFVPNLFLGLDYVKLKRFNEAIPYLKRAAVSKPTDVQAQLGLGQAYRGSGKPRLSIASYQRAVQIEPGNADGWFHLGVSYLEQVENDARVLLRQHKDSEYLQALMAQTFSEQRALIQAADAYKKLLTLPAFPPDTHASFGFVLLNRHDLPEAEHEFNAELVSNSGSLTAKLGLARLHIEQGAAAQSVKEIGDLWKTDTGFLRANASLFITGLVQSKRSEFQRVLDEGQVSGDVSQEMIALFRDNATQAAGLAGAVTNAEKSTSASKNTRLAAAKLYAKGNYQQCAQALAPQLSMLQIRELRLLASCEYSTGNYGGAFDAAVKLASNAATEAEGLYWETKSAQKLASASLAHASELDSSSPKMHVLLGDLYRQQKNVPAAEQEYRKALGLQPEDAGALFGLSLALLANSQLDEALALAQAALEKHSDDPELNAVMGEILCARDDFSGAEPYLKKSLNTKPELLPRVHALLGKVYAQTDRTSQAIAELKLALADDKDGHIHYQIARLYLKVGDRDSAKQAFEVSDQIRRHGLTRAAVAMQQGQDKSDFQ